MKTGMVMKKRNYMKVIIFIYGLFFHYLHIMVKPWKLSGTIFTNIRILKEEPLPKLLKHIISFLKIQTKF